MNSGRELNRCCRATKVADGLGPTTAVCWKAFSGCSRPGRVGAICPRNIPVPSTCWRRLARWEKQGVWLNVWRAFLSELDARGPLDWEESFLDASFAP